MTPLLTHCTNTLIQDSKHDKKNLICQLSSSSPEYREVPGGLAYWALPLA